MHEDIKKQFEELEKQLVDPSVISNSKKLTEASKKHSELKDVIGMIFKLEKVENNISQNKELIKEDDEELKKMAETELVDLKKQQEELSKKIHEELNPDDPNDKKNIMIEIRAGTGGDESALFVAEMFRMYSKYAEKHDWEIGILHSNSTGIGGFKEVIFEIKGKNAYKYFKYEAGTHRVQRIPETEKQGRVHTSAITIAVLPEAEEVDLEIKNEDLKIDTYAASGPGGQCVNTTNSAVRITHLPTNTVVQCQDQKSQHQNKDKAMLILRSRLLQKIEQEKADKEGVKRKQQIGTGDRSEKIRTYNFPQDRITDHRIKKSWSQINNILEGNLEDIINSLQEY
jgi:peptide chain release factor 1